MYIIRPLAFFPQNLKKLKKKYPRIKKDLEPPTSISDKIKSEKKSSSNRITDNKNADNKEEKINKEEKPKGDEQ